jgi:hypothetical protein
VAVFDIVGKNDMIHYFVTKCNIPVDVRTDEGFASSHLAALYGTQVKIWA